MVLNGSVINGAVINGSAELTFVPSNLGSVLSVRYSCYLTGTPDLVLPISNFSVRKNNAKPSYCSVTVPSYSYIDGINARLSGELVIDQTIYYLDGTSTTGELIRVTLENVTPYKGTNNQSIVLDGHATTVTLPKLKEVTGVSYFSVSNGLRRYRSQVDFDLEAGDTVSVDGDEFEVEAVTINVSVGQATMEFSELAG